MQDSDQFARHRSHSESKLHRFGCRSPPSPSTSQCILHKEKHMYFCSDCEKLLCSLCLSNGSHRQHEWAELANSLGRIEASLERMRRSAQEALYTAAQQRSNLHAEQDRVSNLCTTARSVIRSRHTAIRHQLDSRKASLFLLHEQTDSQHRFLNHTHPSEILQPELSKVQAIQQTGEITLVKLRSHQISALGKVTTAMGNLKKVQLLLKTTEQEWLQSSIQSLPQYDAANSDTLESLVRLFGTLETSGMQPVLRQRRHKNTKVPLLYVQKKDLAIALSPRHVRPVSSGVNYYQTLPRTKKDSCVAKHTDPAAALKTPQTDEEDVYDTVESREDLDESYDDVQEWHSHKQNVDDEPIYEERTSIKKR